MFANSLHVSKTEIQQIVTEFRDIVALVCETNRYAFNKSLTQQGITGENTVKLVKETLCQKYFSRLSEVGSLGTCKRRLSFFKNKFSVVNPVKYVLDFSLQRTFVYVPNLNVFQILLNRGDLFDN